MSKIGRLWNALANPDRIPKLFSVVLAVILLIGFIVPMTFDVNQVYPRPVPQEQVEDGIALAPYYRGGVALEIPGIVKAQYPENSEKIGEITAFLSPQASLVSSLSPYFGTSIYSSPGGLIDEMLYYTRGLDTILESTILMMSFIIASWLVVNFTMNTRRIEKDSQNKNFKGSDISNTSIDNSSDISEEEQ